jgi:hypothetical protein
MLWLKPSYTYNFFYSTHMERQASEEENNMFTGFSYFQYAYL